MKIVTAFVHRGRVSDVIHALEAAGFRYLTVIDVKGLLNTIGSHEEHYSIELGEKVTDEVKLKLICEENNGSNSFTTTRVPVNPSQALFMSHRWSRIS